MAKRLAFFDVDCMELDDTGQDLGFRPRVAPITEKVTQLHSLAESWNYPLLFTTCCSGRMLCPDSFSDTLFVPLAGDIPSWKKQIPNFRKFYIAKKTYGDPLVNGQCRAYDMFQDNANISHLVQVLGADEWVVFGNGFSLCVNSAVEGLLAANQRVCLLTNVHIPSAGETPELAEALILRMKTKGIRMETFEELIQECS